MNRTIKIKKKILAIPAEAPAIPPNPKIPAIIAITIKIIVQRNIVSSF